MKDLAGTILVSEIQLRNSNFNTSLCKDSIYAVSNPNGHDELIEM